MAQPLLVGFAGFDRPGNPAGKADLEPTNKSGMNGNILIGVLAEQSREPGFGNLVQSYWYAIFLLPAAYFVAKLTKQKRRGKVYRW